MTRCARCGEENPADARFCIECGGALAPASTGPTVKLGGPVCAACGTPNPEHAQFCVTCGRSFEERRPAPPRAAPPRAVPPPRPQVYPRPAPQPIQPRWRASGWPAPPVVLLVVLLGALLIPGLVATGALAWLAGRSGLAAVLVLASLVWLVAELASGRGARGAQGALVLLGVGLMLATGMFWPGVLFFFFFFRGGRRRGRW